MRLYVLLILVFSAFAMLSCGGDGTVGPDSGDVIEPLPTLTSAESALWDRASAAFQSADGRAWEAMYDFLSPQAQDTCDRAGYAGRVGSFASVVQRFMGLGDEGDVVFRVRDVRVEGTEGAVFLDVISDGEPVLYGETPQVRWVSLNGQWWEENENWQDGCVGWKAFG